MFDVLALVLMHVSGDSWCWLCLNLGYIFQLWFDVACFQLRLGYLSFVRCCLDAEKI